MTRPLPFVLAATDQGTMILSHLDFCRVPSGEAYGVGASLLYGACYEPHEIGVIIQAIDRMRADRGDDLIVLDVGANIGVHTVCLARHMTGWGQVVAVEAQERVFYALCGNIALGNHFNARAICAAAGAADGWIDMPQPDYTAPASLGSFEVIKKTGGDTGQDIDYAAPSTRVRQMAIDSLALPRCDFIKLDCEGMEVEALAGARETIARCRPAMFIEVTKSDADGIKAAISDGYKVYPVSNGIVVMP